MKYGQTSAKKKRAKKHKEMHAKIVKRMRERDHKKPKERPNGDVH